VVAVCVAFALGALYKDRLFGFVDRFSGRILFATVVVPFTTILLVYHTQHSLYDLERSVETDLLTIERSAKFMAQLEGSNIPRHIPAPVPFQYIDRLRVDELYKQIEPDLIEKERTVATTGSLKGKVGVAVSGALNAEAEARKGISSTSSFARADFSSERKCIDLMNYVLERRSPRYYTDSRSWFRAREYASVAAQMELDKRSPIDSSKIRPIKPVDGTPSEKATEEEKQEAERKAKEYQSELQNELKSLSEYVFVDGEFHKAVNGDTLILVETFSKKPFKALFRVNVPSAQMPVFQNHNGLRLKVFGSVISPLGSDGYVDIRPIAAY